jgi:class 3 adenylate cyclase
MAPASHSVLHLDVVAGGPAAVDVDILDGHAIPARARLGPGAATLRMRNCTSHPAGVLLVPDPIPPPEARRPGERPPGLDLRPFLTGKRVIMAQAFRDLFRADTLPAEGGLALKSMTVLFTDLKGSTELYERIGDLRAFDLVRQHFATLRDAVASEGGGVVKTIGDAVMASFAEPRSAMAAAIAMQRGIAGVGGGELRLKIGLHAGPCIAVDLNDRLDYFGRTVNLAARVQDLAQGREIVCTEAVYEAAGVGDLCREAALGVARERATLRGIDEEMAVLRLR